MDRKPGNVLAKYLPALRRGNGTDSHDGLDPAFPANWRRAARDTCFQQAQRVFLRNGNLSLNPPLDYKVYGDSCHRPLRTSSARPRHARLSRCVHPDGHSDHSRPPWARTAAGCSPTSSP